MTKSNRALNPIEEQAPNSEIETSGNYEAVKYNAMTHGILSRHTVLPHKDRREYEKLLSLMTQEHQPHGMTEAHLVEELAGIVWRKQRVLQAEAARIKDGLKSASVSSNLISSSLPFHSGMSCEGLDVVELLRMTPEESTEYRQTAADELNSIRKAEQILDSGKPNYKSALNCLCAEDRDFWDQTVEDEENNPTVEDLLAFVLEHLKPWCERQMIVAQHITEIKAHALGKAIEPLRLEKLNRYETHLDRKFQRTLAMLIKLKELRNAQVSN